MHWREKPRAHYCARRGKIFAANDRAPSGETSTGDDDDVGTARRGRHHTAREARAAAASSSSSTTATTGGRRWARAPKAVTRVKCHARASSSRRCGAPRASCVANHDVLLSPFRRYQRPPRRSSIQTTVLNIILFVVVRKYRIAALSAGRYTCSRKYDEDRCLCRFAQSVRNVIAYRAAGTSILHRYLVFLKSHQ